MKRILLLALAIIFIATGVYAHGIGPGLVKVKEGDGSPAGWVKQITVDNGSLTVSGSDATIDLSGAAGGQAITLDIGDDAGDDSVDLGEIATTGDTNSIFTESAADKLLIDLGNNWPTADAATTATVGTTVTITDNEDTNETNAVIFTAGGDLDGGNIGLESDGDFTYDPDTGTLTATALAATLTDGGILLGSGTGAITALGAAANGQIPIGDGTTAPQLANITETTDAIVITNGAASIVLSAHANVEAIADGTLKLDDLATPDDNTDLDASATEHGLAPKLSDNASTWYDGKGLWSAPTAAETGAEPDLADEAALYSTLSDVTIFYEPGDTLRGGGHATDLPETCTVYEQFIDLSEDSDGSLFICIATDTWKDVDDDGGGNEVVDDATPQLGGDLDLNGSNIDFPTTANISDVLDEDNMVSDSATMLATQQSIKKYVDDNVSAGTVTISGTPVADDIAQWTSATAIKGMTYAELAATGLDAALEAVLDIENLQGAATDGQVPNDITIDLATSATTAVVATTVTITDNENTNETNAIIFTAGGDLDGGDIGLESDGDFTYDPDTGTVLAPIISSPAFTVGTTGSISEETNTMTLNDGDGAAITLDQIRAGTTSVGASSTTEILYNNAGSLDGLAGVTINGTDLQFGDGIQIDDASGDPVIAINDGQEAELLGTLKMGSINPGVHTFYKVNSGDWLNDASDDTSHLLSSEKILDELALKADLAGPSITGAPAEFCAAASDETTSLTVADDKVNFRLPFAMTLTEVRASVNTAPTGATIIVDIEEAGTTVLSTLVTIDATEATSTTAATPAVISDSALADDALISVNVDQIGSSEAGDGLKICLIGTRSW